MITTDSRGVQYDISTVRAHRRHSNLTFPGAKSSQIVERISDRPVGVKRKERSAKKELRSGTA
jgi:hypothetical protein